MTSQPDQQRLPTNPYPTLERTLRLGEQIWYQREDVRQAFPDINAAEFWYWLMWHGTEAHPEVLESLYPFPSHQLLSRVVGEISRQDFLRGGLVNWLRFVRCIRDQGVDLGTGETILDFGCGCARLLRHFAFYSHGSTLHGADVDPDAVRWAAAELDFATFSVIDSEPPTPYEDGTFDIIYAYSVFSHLPEKRHLSWLQELKRIARPDGLVILTTQGQNVIDLALSGERDLGTPSREDLRQALPSLNEQGFAFFPYRQLELRDNKNQDFFADWDLEEYGMSFITERYIRETWSQYFTLVDFHPAPDEWQDFIVLRRD